MNKNLYTFYVAITSNEVICFDTNLKLFVERLNKQIPDTRNYDWFYRNFKIDPKINQVIKGKEYTFQRII